MNDFWYLSKDKSKNFKWSKLSFDSTDKSASSMSIANRRARGPLPAPNGHLQGAGVHGRRAQLEHASHSGGCPQFAQPEVVQTAADQQLSTLLLVEHGAAVLVRRVREHAAGRADREAAANQHRGDAEHDPQPAEANQGPDEGGRQRAGERGKREKGLSTREHFEQVRFEPERGGGADRAAEQ